MYLSSLKSEERSESACLTLPLSASSHITFFFSVPFWQPPRWKRSLTQQPIGPKRQRGEKRPEIHSFISIPLLLSSFSPCHWLLVSPSCSFLPGFSSSALVVSQ